MVVIKRSRALRESAGRRLHGGAEMEHRRVERLLQITCTVGICGTGLGRKHAPIEQAQIVGQGGQLAFAALDHRDRLRIVEARQRANVLAGAVQNAIETIEPLYPR